MNARIVPAATLLFVSSLVCGGSAAAATVIKVSLQDHSTEASIASMHIVVDRDSAPAGKITFRAVNQSKDQVHELIVVRSDSAQALPYDEKKQEVVEKRIRHLGEIADLKPGRSGSLTLNLGPGSYVLICNQPGHYKAGMSTPFSVTK
jgi:uncharacterized cupredoxin-like copper-binding protein